MTARPNELFGLRNLDCGGAATHVFFGKIGRLSCASRWIAKPTRETAIQYLVRCAKLADIDLQPVFQRQNMKLKKLVFPTIIYTQIGNFTQRSLDGDSLYSTTFRIDCRDKDYSKNIEVLDRFIDCLVQQGRSEYDSDFIDDYDDSLHIYRRIATIYIRS